MYDVGKPILDSISKRGIIENHDVIQNKEDDFSIYVVREGVAEEHELNRFFTLSTADKFIVDAVERSDLKNKSVLVDCSRVIWYKQFFMMIHLLKNRLSKNCQT